MISLILALAVIGILVYCLDKYVPMDASFKKLIKVIVAICVIWWLLHVFGVLPMKDIPVPRFNGVTDCDQWAAASKAALDLWRGGGWQLCASALLGIALWRKPWYRDGNKP